MAGKRRLIGRAPEGRLNSILAESSVAPPGFCERVGSITGAEAPAYLRRPLRGELSKK
jgi:hypothetical protein